MSDLISRQAAIERINKQREHLQPDIYPQDKIGDAAYRICAEFIGRLPSAQPELHWIPCSERLPRQGLEVICQCRANMIKVLKLDAYGDWYQDAEHSYMSGFVIAWMPLPEPYRAKRITDE